MKHPSRFVRVLLSATICFFLAGCFFYTKEEHQAEVPVVDTPGTTSSSTTTTTTVPDTDGTIERQRTTTTYPSP